MELLNQLSISLQAGDGEKVAEFTKQAISQNVSPKTILDDGLIAGMNIIGEKFGKHGIKFKLIPMIDGGGVFKGKPYPQSYTPQELEIIEHDWLDEYYPLNNTQANL